MAFFPYEKFNIISKLKPQELEEKLASNIGKYKFRIFNLHDGTSKPYHGYIYKGLFEITRNIQYRNSFLPQISGAIQQDVTGESIIAVTMKMHILVIIFMCLWLGITGILGIVLLIQGLINNAFDPIIMTPLGMFLFGYCLATFAFKHESKISTDFLLELTDGYIR